MWRSGAQSSGLGSCWALKRNLGVGQGSWDDLFLRLSPEARVQVACAQGSSLAPMSGRGILQERLRLEHWPLLPPAGSLCGLGLAPGSAVSFGLAGLELEAATRLWLSPLPRSQDLWPSQQVGALRPDLAGADTELSAASALLSWGPRPSQGPWLSEASVQFKETA